MLKGDFPVERFRGLRTPFYYYDLPLLRRTLDAVQEQLRRNPDYRVHYAVKANFNPRILAEIAARVERELGDVTIPLKVAVMGCVVNGIGEGREADVGIAGGGNGTGVLFRKGGAQGVPCGGTAAQKILHRRFLLQKVGGEAHRVHPLVVKPRKHGQTIRHGGGAVIHAGENVGVEIYHDGLLSRLKRPSCHCGTRARFCRPGRWRRCPYPGRRS